MKLELQHCHFYSDKFRSKYRKSVLLHKIQLLSRWSRKIILITKTWLYKLVLHFYIFYESVYDGIAVNIRIYSGIRYQLQCTSENARVSSQVIMNLKLNLILLVFSLILLSWNYVACKKQEPPACRILKVQQCTSMKYCNNCPSVCQPDGTKKLCKIP